MKFWRAQEIEDGDHGFFKPWRSWHSRRLRTSFELNKKINGKNDGILWNKDATSKSQHLCTRTSQRRRKPTMMIYHTY
jgi:hypothetical protein